MFDIKALENDQIYKWNVMKLKKKFFLCIKLCFLCLRDHQTHLKRIDEIVKSKKKTARDLVLLEHIKNMHQAKAVSRKTMQTGYSFKNFTFFYKRKKRKKLRNK